MTFEPGFEPGFDPAGEPTAPPRPPLGPPSAADGLSGDAGAAPGAFAEILSGDADLAWQGPGVDDAPVRRSWLHSACSQLASLLVHAVAMIVLALWVLEPWEGRPAATSLTVAAAIQAPHPELYAREVLLDTSDVKAEIRPVARDALKRERELELEELEVATPRLKTLDADRKAAWSGPSVSIASLERLGGGGDSPQEVAPPVETAGRLGEAGTVEEAVDQLAGAIQRRGAAGPLRVVWLFDASISLLGDRQRIADRLTDVADQLPQPERGVRSEFLMAAAAFGQGTRSLVKPTSRIGRIVAAARDTGVVDPSGRENVLTAVMQAVSEYSWKRGELLVIVWTDEAGDDITPASLESTIAFCRENQAAVHVVGPSSMFNRRKGTQQWLHPLGIPFRLAVDRGPETAVSQRLFLPYWYHILNRPQPDIRQDLLDARGQGVGAMAADVVRWIEDNQLEGVGSGFGPYGLTRLALATGGTYTIFDRPEDRSPFRFETLEKYVPDYRSVDAILAELPYHPLRHAVFQSVRITEGFRGAVTPPLQFGRPGGDPETFQRRFARECRDRAARAEQAAAIITSGLAPFGPQGLEPLYRIESSARWRAWYDLTRGRLLAHQVRWIEYAALCRRFAAGAAPVLPSTNAIRLHPQAHLLAPALTRANAEEATRLLQRCMDENPGTPWHELAKREMAHPLGVDFEQAYLPPPPPPVGLPAGGGGMQISLPSL